MSPLSCTRTSGLRRFGPAPRGPPSEKEDPDAIVFGTATAAALAGRLRSWPEAERSRPCADPYELEVDCDGYVVDPQYDYSHRPTRRAAIAEQLGDDASAADWDEWLLDQGGYDEDDLSRPETRAEIERWLDDELDSEELEQFYSGYEAMRFTEHWPALDIFNGLDQQTLRRLSRHGLGFVDGDHPGSSFFGVKYEGEVSVLNRELRRAGLNLLVRG